MAAHASSPPTSPIPSTADWITAWSTLAATITLGVLGLGFTVWQWRASGFRPHYDAKIDAARTGISLQVNNRGRAIGIILDIKVAEPRNRRLRRSKREFLIAKEEDVKFASSDDERFQAFELPGLTAARVIIKTKDLSPKSVLRIQAGTAHIKTVQLAEAEDKDMRFAGLPSLLPPKAG